MRRFKNRLAKLEASRGSGLSVFVVSRFEEDGPYIGFAWADGKNFTRRPDESEEDFENRVEQRIDPDSGSDSD